MGEPRTTLKVNGEDIPLNEFVNRFFANVLRGMVQSLKGVETPNVIEVKVEFEADQY